MSLPVGLALRRVDDLLHSRQSSVLTLSQEHDLVSRLSPKVTRQVKVLAWKVLVDK